jgi:ATP adenylyltransferase
MKDKTRVKHLFSPWRSTYIQTFNEKKSDRHCLFCRIAKETGDSKNYVAWRGKHCFVVMNKYPYNSGHLMIVPYRHTAHFSKLLEKEYVEIITVTGKCMSAFEHISRPQGFNFGANLGRVAGAGIDKHLHFHLVPRWNGDTNFMPVLSEVKVVSEDIKKNWLKLKILLNPKASAKKS